MQSPSEATFREHAATGASAQLSDLPSLEERDASFNTYLEEELYDPTMSPSVVLHRGSQTSFAPDEMPAHAEVALEFWDCAKEAVLECDDKAAAALKSNVSSAAGDEPSNTVCAMPGTVQHGISNIKASARAAAAAGVSQVLNAYAPEGDTLRLPAVRDRAGNTSVRVPTAWLPAMPPLTEAPTMQELGKRSYASITTMSASPLTNKQVNNKKRKTKRRQQSKENLRSINKFLKSLHGSQMYTPAQVSDIKLHLCNLQGGYLRSALAHTLRERLDGKGDDDHVLFLQHLPPGDSRNYEKGQGKNLRKQPYYDVALSGDNELLKHFEPDADSTAAFAMINADGTWTDYTVCDITKQKDADTGMYYLRFAPRAGGHWALANALWTVPKRLRRGKLHGSIKIASRVYTFNEGFVTESYARGSEAKATEHTFTAEQQ
jgi:hypothetical protein